MKERYLKRILTALASAVLAFSPASAEEATFPIVGTTPKALPAFTYFDAQGQHSFAPKARLTVLHFWATWCVPCLTELPMLASVRDAYAPKGLAVMPLALDGANQEKIETFYKGKGVTLPYFSDHKMTAAGPLKVGTLPVSIFVNAKGEEIARANGAVNWNAPETATFLKKELGLTSEATE